MVAGGKEKKRREEEERGSYRVRSGYKHIFVLISGSMCQIGTG